MTIMEETHDENAASHSHTYRACWTYVYGDEYKGFEVSFGAYATREQAFSRSASIQHTRFEWDTKTGEVVMWCVGERIVLEHGDVSMFTLETRPDTPLYSLYQGELIPMSIVEFAHLLETASRWTLSAYGAIEHHT